MTTDEPKIKITMTFADQKVEAEFATFEEAKRLILRTAKLFESCWK